jgi:hypothetical protein
MSQLWKELMSIKPNAHTERVINYLCVLDDDGSEEGIGFCRTVTAIWDKTKNRENTISNMRSIMPNIPIWLEVDKKLVQWERVFIEFYLGNNLLNDDEDFVI